MSRKKQCVVLLALLLAAMAMVPMVSAAGEHSQDSTVTQGISDPMKDPEIMEILKNAATREALPESISGQIDKESKLISPTFDSSAESYLNNYVSPSQQLITLMKAKKYSNDQITKLLEKNGYNWDPKTGSSWKGTAPTPEEQKNINRIRGPSYDPFSVNSHEPDRVVRDWNGRAGGALQKVVNENLFFGINCYMSPGSMTIGPSGTFMHVVTTHVGKPTPSGQEDWIEAGVVNSMNDPYARYFTFDNDEGEWQFHGAAETGVFKNYLIYVTSNYDPAGYMYHCWIDNNWVRSGHLKARETGINYANEIWTLGTNWFSHDSTNPTFQYGYLYKSSGLQLWGDYWGSLTSWSTDQYGYALQDYYMNGGSWKFISWNI